MTEATVEPLVVGRNLSRTYGRGLTALVAVHQANCLVRPGDQITLTGPSGSGKSTLLHLLAGLDTPTTGEVCWPALGGPPSSLVPGAVGLVFQGPSLLPDLNVIENVALPLVLAGQRDVEARSRALAVLGELDLGDLADKLPEEISGGQAQRASVARALVGQPRLILADEPTGQLDHASAAAVVSLLTGQAEALGAGLVVTTHDPLIAERFDVRWEMADGRLLPGGK